MKLLDKNLPLAKEELNRRTWPFSKMKAGGPPFEVTPGEDWERSVKTAHNYASKQRPKWKFTCNWIKDKNVGWIRRVK